MRKGRRLIGKVRVLVNAPRGIKRIACLGVQAVRFLASTQRVVDGLLGLEPYPVSLVERSLDRSRIIGHHSSARRFPVHDESILHGSPERLGLLHGGLLHGVCDLGKAHGFRADFLSGKPDLLRRQLHIVSMHPCLVCLVKCQHSGLIGKLRLSFRLCGSVGSALCGSVGAQSRLGSTGSVGVLSLPRGILGLPCGLLGLVRELAGRIGCQHGRFQRCQILRQ